MAPKLSAVILTKNEGEGIRQCLENIKWADEIIIVDDCSRDNTIEVCREYTDKIYLKKIENFGEQRNFSIGKASGDWILFFDSDERISEELKSEIRENISGKSDCDYFYIPYKTFYLGKWIRHCGWGSAVEKLFKKGALSFTARKVHEYRIVSGKAGYLKNTIYHYSYRSIEQHIYKMNLFSRWEAEQLYSEGLRLRGLKKPVYLFVLPVVYFFHRYILLAGFLDGREGLLISLFTGIGYFFIYAKVWELQRAEADERK